MEKKLFDSLDALSFTFNYNVNDKHFEMDVHFEEDGPNFNYIVNTENKGVLDVSDFASCFDYEDMASVLAKKFITDSTSTIRVDISCDDYGYESSTTFKEDGSFIQEEPEYKMVVYPNIDHFTMDYVNVQPDDVEQIMEWMDNDDEDGELYDYCWDNVEETVSYLSLFGDEESETLDYEIYDENNETVDTGTIQLSEGNVFNYGGSTPYLNMSVDDEDVQYILLHVDITKRPSCTYDVPKNIKPEELHFFDNDMYKGTKLPIYEVDGYGDTVTSLYGLHYHGMDLECDENDNGTYGDNRYYLFERNAKTGKFDLLKKYPCDDEDKDDDEW